MEFSQGEISSTKLGKDQIIMAHQFLKIEVYLPERTLSNDDLAEIFTDWQPEKIETKIGIRKRHIAGENETALTMAIKAGEKVLADYAKNQIDYLIYCTQSPEYYLPSGACILQDKLGLKTQIGAFDFNLGCSGYIYGLSIAKSLISSSMANNVLLITSDTYSKYIHKLDKSNRTIFGDAASATIIERSNIDCIGKFVLGTDGSGHENLIVPNGGTKQQFDPQAEEVVDINGAIRTANNLYMNGPEIFNFAIDVVPILLNDVLKRNEIQKEDVDYFIFHQANIYMLDYLRKKSKIPETKFHMDIRETGNTVAATLPIAVKQARDSRKVVEGNKVLLLGFGVGYSYGGVLLNF
jgi:3-oxoacyl-[acyl-carrier-protein] synthase III